VGGAPLLIPSLGDPEAALALLPLLDGLFFTGGPDVHPRHFGQEIHPGCERIDTARDATELALINAVRAVELPLFGICRGIQMLNVGFGGDLIQDLYQQRRDALDHRVFIDAPSRIAHAITIDPNSRLASLLGNHRMPTNSLHHQAVETVAPGLVVTATAEDGIVEGVEAPGRRFVVGVQCHPELLFEDDARWLGLFRGFVEAARRTQLERRAGAA